MIHRQALLLATAALLSLVVACGGDDDNPTPTATAEVTATATPSPTPTATATPTPSPTPPPLTTDGAGEIALAGLLTVEDLPPAEWDVTDGDHLDTPGGGLAGTAGDLFGGTPACAEFVAVAEQLGGGAEGPLADRDRNFDAGDGPLLMRSVTSGVIVPDPDLDVDAAFEALRELFDADTLRPCLEEGVAANLENEGDVSVRSVDIYAPTAMIDGGVAIGVDVSAVALILPLHLTLEIHLWPEEPAVGSLIVIEMNSDLLATEMGAILENARERLAEAVAAQ